MFSTKSLAAATAAFALFASSTAEYDPNGKGNTVVYWGSGSGQERLSYYCYDDSIDIIPIAFINSFPAQADGLVGEAYASNACWAGPVYPGPGYPAGTKPNTTNDVLLVQCPYLQQDLWDCQQNTSTKFLISLGGDATTGNYQLDTHDDGVYLAKFLWGAYGPYQQAWVDAGGVRPLDGGWSGTDASMKIDVDGFDFDIEKASPNEQIGYIACINQLRLLFDAYKAENPCCKDYIITGAPQCPRPDDNMSNMINKAKFDIIWPQFYNNGPAGCTARDWVNGEAGFNFADWASDLLAGESKDAKLYLGLLGGASGSAGSPGDYLTPTEAKSLIAAFESSTAFGGVMLWDAVSSFDSTDSLTSYEFTNGTSVPSRAAYYDVIKNYLEVYATSYTPTPSVCSSTTSSSSTSSSSTSTSSSTTTTSSAAVTTTSSSSSSTPTTSCSSTSSAAPTTTSSSSSSSPSAAVSTTTSSAAASSSTTAVVPTHVPSVGSCVRLGCYTEGYNIRALTPFVYTDYAMMSPEICASKCPEYSYFGVEYGGECYCGNRINNGSLPVDDSQCSRPCGGYPGEYCGAGDRLDLYSCGGPSSTSSAAATTSSAAASTSSSSAAPTTSSATASSSTSSAAASSSSSSSTAPTTSSSYPSSSPSSSPTATSSSSVSSLPGSYPSSSSSSSAAASSSSSVSSLPGSYPSSTLSFSSSSSSSATATSSSSVSSLPGSYPSSSSSSSSVSSSSVSSTPSSTGTGSGAAATTSSSISYTTSTVSTTTVYTITSCAATVTDCPAKIGSVTTDTIILYTTVCPVTATETNSGIPTSTAVASSSPVEYTTSTVYATTTYTITSCAPTVTNCPAKLGQVTTDIISLYVTVCPVSEAGATPTPTPSAENTYSTTTLSSTTTQFVTVKVVQSTATLAPYPVSLTTQAKALGTGTGLPAVSLITTTAAGAATPSQFKGAASTSRGPVGVMIAVVLGAAVFMM